MGGTGRRAPRGSSTSTRSVSRSARSATAAGRPTAMRVHVALTPGAFPDLALAGRSALVVDVLRATSMVIAAFAAGCTRVIPVADAARAREEAGALAPHAILL